MCGIFGSNKMERFRTLYKLNLSRGDFAYGGLYESNDAARTILEKHPGRHNISDEYKSYDYFLGHTQAPTSSMRDFDTDSSHPFIFKLWHVAHNGVLSNANAVKKRFLLQGTNDVDTSVIPPLIDHNYINTGEPEVDEIRAITSTLENLDGTFACWFFNSRTKNKYLARVGSTLYGDMSSGDFSSLQDPYSTFNSLSEGVLYKVAGSIREVGKFNFNSPYFIA